MTKPPDHPKIYHIVNVDKLPPIIEHGRLLSHREVLKVKPPGTVIGMETIKTRRLSLPVKCYSNAMVGEFVPFYFCPRSVMLYVIKCASNPELAYKGGQEPIVHLEADLHRVIQWADSVGQSWAFSTSNAGAAYATFFRDVARLDELNWEHISANQWASPPIKEAKQAEFLMYQAFPWNLVDRIGVKSLQVFNQVSNALSKSAHKPKLDQVPGWYY